MTKSILTEEEKWYFDLHGFLILKDVITAKNLKQMLNTIQNWLEMDELDLPPPVTRGRQEPCKTHINNIQYGDKIFQDLAMDPQILRVVAGLTMNSPRLFHYNFTIMTKDDQAKGSFHRDDSGFKFPPDFRNPHNDYQVGNGKIYCSHIATWVALVDVPRNTGFCVVPGSHKSSFQRPKTYRSNMIHQHQLRSPFKPAT